MSGPLIALAAGGTGGHVFPAQAVANALNGRGYSTLLLTDSRGAAFAEAIPDFAYSVLPAATFRGGIVQRARGAGTIGLATVKAARLLRARRARLLIGFGGYPAFAPCLAARLLRLPLILHEQGTTFSLANRKLLPLATRIALSFPLDDPVARQARTRHTGPAVRAVIAAVAQSPYPSREGSIDLLVVGGSQSASVFAQTVPDALLALPDALRTRLRLSLQYRGDDSAAIITRLAQAGISAEIAPFFHDIAERLVKAHLVITRSGASTAADIATVGRPVIFVPIPAGGSVGEQRRNAMMFEAAGMGWHLDQADLERGALSGMLTRLFSGDELLTAARASAALGQSNGAEALADIVEELLG